MAGLKPPPPLPELLGPEPLLLGGGWCKRASSSSKRGSDMLYSSMLPASDFFFLKIEATPEVFELSARLKAKPIPYESLLELDEFNSKAQLDKLLNEFDSLGILVAAVSSNDKNSKTSKPTSEFYSKMKKFLRLR